MTGFVWFWKRRVDFFLTFEGLLGLDTSDEARHDASEKQT